MQGIRDVEQGGGHELEQQGRQGPQHGVEGLGAGARQQAEGQVVPLVHEVLQDGHVEAAVLPVDVARVDLDQLVDERARGQLAHQRLVALPDPDAVPLVPVDRHPRDGGAGAVDLLQDLQGRVPVVGVAEIDGFVRCVVVLLLLGLGG